VVDRNKIRPRALPAGVNALKRRFPSTRCIWARAPAAGTAAAGSPTASWRTSCRLRAADGLHACEFLPVSEHPFDGSWGLSADGLFAHEPVRISGRLRSLGRCLPPRRARRDHRLGARSFPRRSAWAEANSTEPRSMSTRIRCKAGIWTGIRSSTTTEEPRLPISWWRMAYSSWTGTASTDCAWMRRLDAVPRLQPARGRLDPRQIRRA
jgi:hypothetical protein